MSERIEALVFDLDGVVTRTAKLHSRAWKRLFDEYSNRRVKSGRSGYAPFDPRSEYLKFIDGKPRQDGIRSFLETRGVRLPLGRPDDPPDAETLFGLGHLKNRYFNEALDAFGPEVFEDAVEAIRKWRRMGLKTAIASSSENCERILRTAGLIGLFDARVDGRDLRRWGLPGKPAPDLFLSAVRPLGVSPGRAAVFEDAIAGVQAGRAGGFGLVVGVDRLGDPRRLLEAGADVVVSKLTELSLTGEPENPKQRS